MSTQSGSHYRRNAAGKDRGFDRLNRRQPTHASGKKTTSAPRGLGRRNHHQPAQLLDRLQPAPLPMHQPAPLVTRRRKSALTAAALASAIALTIAACSPAEPGAVNGTPNAPTNGAPATAVASQPLDFLTNAESVSIPPLLTSLSQAQCAAAEGIAPLNISTQPQADLNTHLQLLAGQNALPTLFAAGDAPALIRQFDDAGLVVDIGSELNSLGLGDAIIPAAKGAIEMLYDGHVIVLPTELNTEGIFYNKQIFAEHGLTPPETWDELLDVVRALHEAGVTPMAASGTMGWPLTRLIGNYLMRSIGPDAMRRIADGEAQLTDPEYVAGAQALVDLANAGAFAPGLVSLEPVPARHMFVSGEAAMFYWGSFDLGNLTDPEFTEIGPENVGFIPFPSVAGGAGARTDLVVNIGIPLGMSVARFDEGAREWLECIAENWGNEMLRQHSALSGFKVTDTTIELPPLTQQVLDSLEEADNSILWFEAHFNPQATTTSQSYAALLATGAITPEQFMAQIQADLD